LNRDTVEVTEVVVRIAGLIISVIGAAIVSPSATRHRWDVTRTASRTAFHKALLAVGLRKVHSVSASVHLSGAGTLGTAAVTGRAYGTSWSDDATVEQKVARLLERVQYLEGRISLVDAEIRSVRAEQQRALSEARTQLTEELNVVRSRLDKAEAALTEDNSRALPIIVLGIVLSGLAPELGSTPWLGLPSIAIVSWPAGRALERAFRR